MACAHDAREVAFDESDARALHGFLKDVDKELNWWNVARPCSLSLNRKVRDHTPPSSPMWDASDEVS